MRRKSTRNTSKKASPEKAKADSPRKTRRQSKRRKRSSSRSSEDSDDDVPLQQKIEISQAIEDETVNNVSENDTSDEESVPLSELETSRGRRHNKSINHKESSTPESRPRRGRSLRSPLIKEDSTSQQENNTEESEEKEEKKGKGKSKSKNKSKIEKSSNIIEPEFETNSEISENAQVTPQSPSNDNPVHNENVDDIHVQNVNQSENVEETNNQEESEEVEAKSELAKEITEESSRPKEETEDQVKIQQKNVEVESEQKVPVNLEVCQQPKKAENDSEVPAIQTGTELERQGEIPADLVVKKPKDLDENPEHDQQQKIEISSESRVQEVVDEPIINPEDDNKLKEQNVIQAPTEPEVQLKFSPKKIIEKSSKEDSSEGMEQTSSRNEDKVNNGDNNASENVEADDSVVEKSSSEVRKTRKSSPQKKVAVEESKSPNSMKLEDIVIERKRRVRSTSTVEDEKEIPKKKNLKRIKLNRNFSEEAKQEESSEQASQKRLRWGQSHFVANLTSTLQKVDVETLKNVLPTLEFLSENEVKLEPVVKEQKKSVSESEKRFDRKSSTDNKSDDSDRPEYDKRSSFNSTSGEQIEAEDNSNIIAMNRKISIVDDTASKLKPPPSPAKNPTSDVLFITNLVRPFTLKQLKELLERTGKVIEEGFWTDRIKSKCYVQYESVEEAEATRNALHGVNWPIGNGKKLMIDYSTLEDLDKAKNPPPPPAPVVPEKVPEKENKEPERKISESESKSSRDREDKQRRRSDGPVREWDLGKEELHNRKRSRTRSRERARKVSRRSPTPTDDFITRKQKKQEEAVPQKLMDDLFLKTKSTPSIYWQPLSPEEIATKQQQRLVRMEEHKRRMEESSRNRGRNDGRGAPFRRR